MNTLRQSTRLGLIACRYLVRTYRQGVWVTASEVAEHYNMNVRALMPALRGLVRAGILRSQVGGRTPGFLFAKAPDEVMLSHVMAALEDHVTVACCKDLIPNLNCDCGDTIDCKVYSLFADLIKDTYARYSRVSVASLAE